MGNHGESSGVAAQNESSRASCGAYEVYPDLFVGNGKSVKDIHYLKNLEITHIVNMAEKDKLSPIKVNQEEYKTQGISYYGADCNDQEGVDIEAFFEPTADFIDAALTAGGKVIVNCVGGMSRSATIATAYLVQKKGMTLDEALITLRAKRDVSPNAGFLLSLIKLEQSLKQ